MIEKVLDKKDIELLKTLNQDVRASFTQLGKKTRLSKETAQYRVKRLQEKGILTGFWIIPSIRNNKFAHKVLIKSKSLDKAQREEFIAFIQQQPSTSWLARTQGNVDFVITSVTEEEHKFIESIQELNKRFSKHLSKISLLTTINAINLPEKWLYEDKQVVQAKNNNFLLPKIDLDEIDKQILTILGEDAKASFTEIGTKIGLTSEGIAIRFKKLKEKNAIDAFKLRVNFNKLNLEYHHLFITLEDTALKEDIIGHYIQHESCTFIMEHVGEYHLHLELVTKPQQIQSVIDELTEQFGNNIASYELLRISEEYKIQIASK